MSEQVLDSLPEIKNIVIKDTNGNGAGVIKVSELKEKVATLLDTSTVITNVDETDFPNVSDLKSGCVYYSTSEGDVVSIASNLSDEQLKLLAQKLAEELIKENGGLTVDENGQIYINIESLDTALVYKSEVEDIASTSGSFMFDNNTTGASASNLGLDGSGTFGIDLSSSTYSGVQFGSQDGSDSKQIVYNNGQIYTRAKNTAINTSWSDWRKSGPIIIADGAVNLYIDQTNGTDDIDYGLTQDKPFASLSYALDYIKYLQLPATSNRVNIYFINDYVDSSSLTIRTTAPTISLYGNGNNIQLYRLYTAYPTRVILDEITFSSSGQYALRTFGGRIEITNCRFTGTTSESFIVSVNGGFIELEDTTFENTGSSGYAVRARNTGICTFNSGISFKGNYTALLHLYNAGYIFYAYSSYLTTEEAVPCFSMTGNSTIHTNGSGLAFITGSTDGTMDDTCHIIT